MSDDKQEHVNSDQKIVQDPDDLHWLIDLSLAPEIYQTDARILLLIYNHDGEPMNQSDVAEELDLDKSRVSERVQHLADLGLLEKDEGYKYGRTLLKPV